MADSLDDLRDHARASADALADPDDLENAVIRSWLGKHVSFAEGKRRWVVGVQTLPVRWRTRARTFMSSDDAARFLRGIMVGTRAVNQVRDAMIAVHGAPLSCSSETAATMLAGYLMNGRAWLMEAAEQIPTAGKTDSAVYATLNAERGTNVDFAYLGRWEGGQYLRGYVPFMKDGVVAGKSGLTIATGFDIGQKTEAQLADLDLDPELIVLLTPFANLRFPKLARAGVLKAISNRGPIPTVTKEQADAIDATVHGEHLDAAIASWNTRRAKGVPAFKELPSAWQTVLFSRTFHQGSGMPNTAVAKPFYEAARTGKWAEAVTALGSYAVKEEWYKARVSAEAALLRTDIPPPVPPPAPAPAATPGRAPAPAGMVAPKR